MKLRKLKLLLCYIVAIAAALTLCWLLYMQTVMRWQAGSLVKREQYSEAAVIYDKIGSGKKAQLCMQMQTEKDYLDAKALMDSGDYDGARAGFVALPGYKDSAALIESCDYLKAERFAAEGNFHQARALLLTLPEGYPGREQALESCNESIYLAGMDYALRGMYKAAIEQWQPLEGYSDSEKLIYRAQNMLDWLNGGQWILSNAERYSSSYCEKVYKCDEAYIVLPQNCSRDCEFLLYYPGGMDVELNIDFLNYYLMNPAPNTIAVFLRQNGIDYMEEKNAQALELLERVAAECGVFVHDIVVVGSSMGAYPAAHSPRLAMAELGIRVDCVLALDAGGDWGYEYALNEYQCIQTVKTGAEFYLFESPGVGMGRAAIRLMVYNDVPVTMVACYFDEHERMTYDAMGMGILHWAVGDRTEDCGLDIYTFNKLERQ